MELEDFFEKGGDRYRLDSSKISLFNLVDLLCTPMIYVAAGKYIKLHDHEKMFNFLVKTMLQMVIILIIICYFHIYMIKSLWAQSVFYSHLQLSFSLQYLAS